MARAPVFHKTEQPWPQWPCDSEEEVEAVEVVQASRKGTISVPISPGSRLYERAFSTEIKQCSVSSHVVLQCGGLVLANGNEEQKHETYSEEFDGQKWDFFISHNWSVKRWQKFLALCLVGSGKKALIFCVCAQLIFFTLVSTGILPVTHSQIDGHEISIWCVGSCLVTYAATFLVHHEVLDLLGIPGYRIFLDKVCVDQSDDQRKRQGIQSITAFLYHSEALVVLYSEIYLKRLWTVFELTTFLAMKPEGQLVVQPVILGPVAVYFVIIQCLRIPEMFLVPMAHDQLLSLELLPALGAYGIMALDLLSLLLGSVFLRRWGCSRSGMAEQLQGFTFEAAECELPADRLEILGAIKALARREGLVPRDASTRVCAESFERLVHEIVPKRMAGAFRLTGITCQIACLMSLPSMALVLDLSAVRLRSLRSTQDAGLLLVMEILQDAMFEALMPISIGLAGIVTGIKAGSCCRDFFSITCCFLLLVLGIWVPGANLMPHLVSYLPGSEVTQVLLLGSILTAQCVVLYFLYFDRARRWLCS